MRGVEMIAYHGTIVGGLHTLEPFLNPLGGLKYPVLYLSTNKALSSIYIWSVWNGKYKWMTFGFRDDGIMVYNESFKNGLFEFYNGVKGYIYTCDADFSPEKNNPRSNVVISRESVEIREVEIVENVYERILQFENEGQLVINRFHQLPDEIRIRERRIVLDSIKRLELWKRERPLSDFVSEKFPDLWDEALRSL